MVFIAPIIALLTLHLHYMGTWNLTFAVYVYVGTKIFTLGTLGKRAHCTRDDMVLCLTL